MQDHTYHRVSHPCQLKNRFHFSDLTQRVLQNKRGVKVLAWYLGLAANCYHFDLSLFFTYRGNWSCNVGVGGEECVSRMHSIAQSCCVEISLSLFMSLQELHNQASWERESEQRNVYAAHVGKSFQMWHVSINDTQRRGGDRCVYVCVYDWQVLRVNENITQGQREENKSSFQW